jgi:hypothetical protein
MEEEFESSDVVESTDDISKIQLGKAVDLKQEGNYLIVTTDTGVTFRQRIPANKILNKINEEYILQDMEV